jgi:hypothetical protein
MPGDPTRLHEAYGHGAGRCSDPASPPIDQRRVTVVSHVADDALPLGDVTQRGRGATNELASAPKPSAADPTHRCARAERLGPTGREQWGVAIGWAVQRGRKWSEWVERGIWAQRCFFLFFLFVL